MGRGHYKRPPSRKKGKFNPSDTKNVKHSKIGVWDLYEEIDPKLALVPRSLWLDSFLELIDGLPYIWRMFKDLASMRSSWPLFAAYLIVRLMLSFLPALTLWFSAQLLTIVQSAIDKRKVDSKFLLQIGLGRMACSCANRVLRYANTRITSPLNMRIKQYYSAHIFHAMARLDVPTFADDLIQRQIEQSLPTNSHSNIVWDTVQRISNVITTILQLVSQFSVLMNSLRGQDDATLLATLCFTHGLFQCLNLGHRYASAAVWVATTNDATYIRMEGMKRTVNDSKHRQEIVAGNMQGYLLSKYRECVRKIGDRAGDLSLMLRTKEAFPLAYLIADALQELPQIVFTLRAVQQPASIPVSLASLNLMMQTTSSFTQQVFSLINVTESITGNVAKVKRLYEMTKIPNQVADGSEAFPGDHPSLDVGISVEFRSVSFRYPGIESYALRNTSFRVLQGQLCVIVGENGSGKSTILKLIARLYEPSEGVILINGRDIRTLKLEDLRRTISVLFQDYTLFPLSIKDNIGLGDPDNATDDAKIREAAQLAGAADLIENLPNSFDTYLERPVRDHYSGLPEGTTSLFGRPVDYGLVRSAGGIGMSNNRSLSGGQMQRIALSRTFMRSLVSQSAASLLLFDEPSASLDPTAEHELFEQLRRLRANKTMIFSSHRFGNLTRHADLILYLSNSMVIEQGTHEQLLKRDGSYACLWKLQAQTFLP